MSYDRNDEGLRSDGTRKHKPRKKGYHARCKKFRHKATETRDRAPTLSGCDT